MEGNFDNKEVDTWAEGILLERGLPPQSLLIKSINYVDKKDTVLILGDACQINSKYLGETAGFKHIDNVDISPMVLDKFYPSEKITPYKTTFGMFEYPEDKHDFVYGKSITFSKREAMPHILKGIANSLHIGGIFSATFYLQGSEYLAKFGLFEKEEIETLLAQTGLTYIESNEIEKPLANLHGEVSESRKLNVIMRKEHK